MKALQIDAYKCKSCGRVHYPFHDRCLNCRGRDFEVVKPAGDARLLTFTQIFNLPWGFDQRFLIIGVGEFENGVRAMGQVQADGIDGLQLGMLLKPRWAPVRTVDGEKVYGIVYEPLS